VSAGSAYPLIKAALITRLTVRAGLQGVNILAHPPISRDELRSPTGRNESIFFAGATGPFADVIMSAGDLRFDETPVMTVVAEVTGTTSEHTQLDVDARCNELVYEVLTEIAGQHTWPLSTYGLDVFNYVWFTPASGTWNTGRIDGIPAGAYGASFELGLQVQARRTLT
jgi:hypothetical protein